MPDESYIIEHKLQTIPESTIKGLENINVKLADMVRNVKSPAPSTPAFLPVGGLPNIPLPGLGKLGGLFGGLLKGKALSYGTANVKSSQALVEYMVRAPHSSALKNMPPIANVWKPDLGTLEKSWQQTMRQEAVNTSRLLKSDLDYMVKKYYDINRAKISMELTKINEESAKRMADFLKQKEIDNLKKQFAKDGPKEIPLASLGDLLKSAGNKNVQSEALKTLLQYGKPMPISELQKVNPNFGKLIDKLQQKYFANIADELTKKGYTITPENKEYLLKNLKGLPGVDYVSDLDAGLKAGFSVKANDIIKINESNRKGQ